MNILRIFRSYRELESKLKLTEDAWKEQVDILNDSHKEQVNILHESTQKKLAMEENKILTLKTGQSKLKQELKISEGNLEASCRGNQKIAAELKAAEDLSGVIADDAATLKCTVERYEKAREEMKHDVETLRGSLLSVTNRLVRSKAKVKNYQTLYYNSNRRLKRSQENCERLVVK